jgi:bifunctional non-homologous end joining protein LigD
MLVSSGPLPADSRRYAFEVKWDGYRALIDASPGGVTMWSRNGHVLTGRYPELQGLGRALSCGVVLDGEIVAVGEDGKPDFAALWFRTRGSSERPVCFMAFDVLRLDGEDVMDRPYRERRALLEGLQLQGSHWRTPESHVGAGEALLESTRRLGLEGVVVKRLDSRYRPGLRSKAWIKSKHMQTRTFALLGWIPPQEWRGDRGCVVLGLRSENGISVAGVVESGYGRELVDRLPQFTRNDYRRLQAGGSWHGRVELVGEVQYLEWSSAGGLRHATLRQINPIPEES